MGEYNMDSPYPEMVIDRFSMRDVRCITDDYASSVSETTAIFQYVYQSYVAGKYGKEWSDMFMGLAMVEMHHHSMLGKAITALGGNPIIAGNRAYWNGAFVSYARDLVKMIDIDIIGERQAIAEYRRAIECLDNFSLVEMIERIIMDEEKHIEILTAARERAIKQTET